MSLSRKWWCIIYPMDLTIWIIWGTKHTYCSEGSIRLIPTKTIETMLYISTTFESTTVKSIIQLPGSPSNITFKMFAWIETPYCWSLSEMFYLKVMPNVWALLVAERILWNKLPMVNGFHHMSFIQLFPQAFKGDW